MILRIYLGDFGGPFIDVQVTSEQLAKLRESHRVGIDDGGIYFAELILTY